VNFFQALTSLRVEKMVTILDMFDELKVNGLETCYIVHLDIEFCMTSSMQPKPAENFCGC
jgi:hypothetical protein